MKPEFTLANPEVLQKSAARQATLLTSFTASFVDVGLNRTTAIFVRGNLLIAHKPINAV
jgi:hypothetical protein